MHSSKRFWRGLFFLLLITALCGGLALPVVNTPARAAPQMQTQTSTPIVISQVYGGGGNGGATFTNDFIELFNRSGTAVDITGWSVQYAAATGTSWQVTPLTNISVPAGRYYLVQLGSGGSIGNSLPTPDVIGTTPMSASAGKVALVNTTTALSDSGCPVAASVVDFVGYGSGADCFEGSEHAPAPSNNATADLRKDNGCYDTDNNDMDFATGTVTPRNSESPALSCTRVTDVTSSVDDGIYTTGDVIDVTITFSNIVNVTGTLTLLLETGATDRTATYASGSGSDTLTFEYTVMAGDSSNDLDYVSTNSLVLNSGTITDDVGPVILTLPIPGSLGSLSANQDIMVDGLAPTVTVNQATGQSDPASTTPIIFSVVFSEAINPSSFIPSDITHTGTATGVTWTITDSGNHTNFTLSASFASQNNVTLIPSIAADEVTDIAGNGNIASTSTDNSVTYNDTPTTGSANSVVISEFRTRGPGGGNDEFVEIYNPTANPVDISNWILSASNVEGSVQNRATIPAGTLLRSGQYYLFAHNSYIVPSGGVSPNLRYGTSIPNDGGVAILNASGDIIDQVGMSGGSFYQEGETLPAFSGTSNGSYERLDGGDLDSCVDTDDNENDFQNSNSSSIHNYSSPLSLCGTDRPALISSTTLITGDTPDPSTINGNVVVSVRVTGTSLSPSGSRVYITGANTNCTITLNSSGTGSCLVKFTTNGTKTITATYLGDNTHQGSSDTETHTVGTATTIRTPTRVPTAVPPPPLIVINEFVPRPGHDWNNDGVINTDDEYIELLNHGVVDVNLSGYTLDDEVNIGSAPFRLPSVTLRPGERRVFYGSETGLLLSDGGDGVRLLKPNGQLGDAYNYRVVRFPDQSYCRLPDNGGADDWNQNCFPTPGLQNSLSGSTVNPPTSGDAENLCPIADTLPTDFVFAECPPFGNNIWNPAYWDRNGWYGERNLPNSPGKWNVFVD